MQRGGLRRHTQHFVLVVLESDRADSPVRLGVTVSSRVGGAVQRNRVKRRVRELFRRRRGSLEPGQDLVVIAKEGAPGLTNADVSAELVPVLEALSRVTEEGS